MHQSSSGVLVSIILIVGLAVAFALGIHYVSSGLASTALPAPTATARPGAVIGPNQGNGGGTRGTSHPSSGSPRGTATPTVHAPAPKPTAAPVPQARVEMSAYLGPGETAASKASTFLTSVTKVYCVATFRHVSASDTVAFRYSNAENGTQIWQSGRGDIVPPITTTERGTSRATYLQGPLNSGKYRCDLLINDKVVSSAPFTVQ